MKRFLPVLLTLCLLFGITSGLSVSAARLTEGVSLLNPKQHVRGSGYYWNNIEDTLTLNGLDLVTEDDYGFKLPHGATVILKGRNYIKAAKAAIYLEGNVIFRGSGSLTLIGGEFGIHCNGTNTEQKLTITEGTYTITGGTDGIRSDFQRISLSGGNLTVTGTKGYSINVRDLQTSNNVTIKATGSFHTSYNMLLQASNLTIESKEAALMTDKYMKLESMTKKAGDSLSSLSEISDYVDQKALVTRSTFDDSRKSLLFGGNVPFAVDILVLLGVLILLAAVIAVPLLLKKKRALDAMAARDAAEAEQRLLRKQAKKK
ncbi:MAG: carbohydrate-binding domain-containing protein [Clostridia bacterium]|nr:carbohydrate-binding domain-containing protein [Clostridia bacterium]